VTGPRGPNDNRYLFEAVRLLFALVLP
jgi:hypothetical protein